ncbi:hypothetical protein CANINC_004449 [Pichia inconspicua]|uniref:Pre-mRNA-processing factor 19 n=1 Tax=Pichia inconspicua TaxID=52247 RepID=A0A4T0WWH8_9ASCO|nr:hypothetical protein CANINC_004449 [[Candida] inconspicua]
MLLCSLTNSPTQHPVLSLKSKCVFDSKALELYINNNGSDPITNEQMTKDDIVPITLAPSDIPSSAELTDPTYSSIPTMLTAFQNAWDSLSLELFHLRSELDKTKKELSLALYRQDAAVKVAVAACKERDEARHALTQLIANGDNHNVDVPLETVPTDETFTEFKRLLHAEQEQLMTIHKKSNKEKKGKSPLYSLDLQNLKLEIDKKSVLSRKNAVVMNVDTNLEAKETIVVYSSGLVEVIDYSKVKLKVVAKFKADNPHAFWLQGNPYILFSENGEHYLVNIKSNEKLPVKSEITEIQTVVAHPTLNIFIVVGSREMEVFFNQESVYEQEFEDDVKKVKFHPDGLLLGIAYKHTRGIDIYDIVERTTKLNIECQNPGDVIFAANGYQMFIATNNKVILFDMRKAIIVLEAPIEDAENHQIIVDDYTSMILCNNNYFILTKNGKAIEFTSKLEIESNGRVIGYASSMDDGECYFISTDSGIYKAKVTN